MNIFQEIHSSIPREGPGDAQSTQRAFSLLSLPEHPQILDIGCGPGMQTLELAKLISTGEITALDKSQHFLDEVVKRARAANLQNRIKIHLGSMFDLDFPPESFDLIWAEGSIFIIGLERGLREWRPLLKTGGYTAFTHISWLNATPTAEARAFWDKHYPEINTVEANIKTAEHVGYEAISHFTLPTSAWWADYYTPLEQRLISLRQKYKNNAEALSTIEETQAEINLYRKHCDHYGYVFYILRKNI